MAIRLTASGLITNGSDGMIIPFSFQSEYAPVYCMGRIGNGGTYISSSWTVVATSSVSGAGWRVA